MVLSPTAQVKNKYDVRGAEVPWCANDNLAVHGDWSVAVAPGVMLGNRGIDVRCR